MRLTRLCALLFPAALSFACPFTGSPSIPCSANNHCPSGHACSADGLCRPDTDDRDDGPDDSCTSPQDESSPFLPGCAPTAFTTSMNAGIREGLPTQDVPVQPATNPLTSSFTPSSKRFSKQVAILNPGPVLPGGQLDAYVVEHLLRPMGIPYSIVSKATDAVAHDVIILYPESFASNFDSADQTALTQFVQGGGTLILKYADVAFLKQLAGVSSASPNQPTWLSAIDLTSHGINEFPTLDHANERRLPLGGNASEYLHWLMSLQVDSSATGAKVLANYVTGSNGLVAGNALVKNSYGAGTVYTFGFDFKDVVVRNQLARHLGANRGYVNTFEPASDIVPLMVRDLYEAKVPLGVRIHSAPSGKRAAFIISHDLDSSVSYDNAVAYAEAEKASGISASYMMQPKYVVDYKDSAFFDENKLAKLRQVVGLGGAVGSHSVAHSSLLSGAPVGTGTESYPSYQPYNVDASTTNNLSLFGELRVSKALIDAALASACVPHHTRTFRSGHLSFHRQLAETMERMGYGYDSSLAIGDCVTNFPFRMMRDFDSNGVAFDTSVYEFPVAIEDEGAPAFHLRVASSLDVVSQNANNGAPTVMLVHPNVVEPKLQAQKDIVAGLPAGVGVMNLDNFGDFWRAKDQVELTSIVHDAAAKELRIQLEAPLAVRGLTLRVPSSVVAVAEPTCAVLSTLVPQGRVVTLPALSAGQSLTVRLTLP